MTIIFYAWWCTTSLLFFHILTMVDLKMATLSFSHKTSSIYGVWATPLGTGKVTHLHIRMTNFHAKFPVHGCGSGWNVVEL